MSKTSQTCSARQPEPHRQPTGQRRPRMLSAQARGVVRIVATWERCHAGRGVRDAASQARRAAETMAVRLNLEIEASL